MVHGHGQDCNSASPHTRSIGCRLALSQEVTPFSAQTMAGGSIKPISAPGLTCNRIVCAADHCRAIVPSGVQFLYFVCSRPRPLGFA